MSVGDLGFIPQSGRSFPERAYAMSQTLLADRLVGFVLKGKEDERRDEFLNEAIIFFRSAKTGLMISSQKYIASQSRFPMTGVFNDCKVVLDYIRTKYPKLDADGLEIQVDKYLLTLTEFRNNGVYTQQKLDELIEFYKWYGEYYFGHAR